MAAMERGSGNISAAQAASALGWWVEAGVDVLVGEEPRDWLKPKAPAAESTAAPPGQAEPAPEPMPDRLDRFQAWLVESSSLPYASPAAPRVGPAGDPASGLMAVVDMPAPEDLREGRLLAGEVGALFDRMLAAIERSRDSLYLASLSPLRSPSGMMDPPSVRRFGEVARHHVGLVRPKALLLIGDACARALLGGPVARTRGRWHDVETPAGPVRALATIKVQDLLARRELKKLAWADLQMLKEALE